MLFLGLVLVLIRVFCRIKTLRSPAQHYFGAIFVLKTILKIALLIKFWSYFTRIRIFGYFYLPFTPFSFS